MTDQRVSGERRYPFPEGETIVLGPEIFAAKDGSVICWKGENYVPATRLQEAEGRVGELEALIGKVHDRMVRLAEIPPWNANPDSMRVSFLEIATDLRRALPATSSLSGHGPAEKPTGASRQLDRIGESGAESDDPHPPSDIQRELDKYEGQGPFLPSAECPRDPDMAMPPPSDEKHEGGEG